jgi:hypothetical protein
VPFQDAAARTIDWYVKSHERVEVQRKLQTMLTER